MKYLLKARRIDVATGGKNIIVLNADDARNMGISPLDRMKVSSDGKSVAAIVDLSKENVKKGEVGLFYEPAEKLKVSTGGSIWLELMEKPLSVDYIKQKMDGQQLSESQINAIIKDVMNDSLSDVELTAFITTLYINGMTDAETISLTNAIVNSGSVIKFNKKPIMSKHSIGGVPGNRTSLIIIPIIAASGLLIPKTSSRAITSPAGTADTMEVLAPVSLNEEEIVRVVNKVGGCIVWGGAMNLAAADDKLIKIRQPLKLDPRGVLFASILAKKKAEGATHVLIDIPIGRGAKIYTKNDAEILAKDFMALGAKLDLEIQCIITPGYDPIGAAVGPALEARECLRILEGEKVSLDLIEKSLVMAGILLEIAGKASPGKGRLMAEQILTSGKALAKMKEIIKAQGGNPNITSKDVQIGSKQFTVISKESGRIHFINTDVISAIAIAAGAPSDKGAGVYMHVEKGDKLKKGDRLFTIYSDSQGKLDAAKEIAETKQVIDMDRVILGRTYMRHYIH